MKEEARRRLWKRQGIARNVARLETAMKYVRQHHRRQNLSPGIDFARRHPAGAVTNLFDKGIGRLIVL